MKNRNILFLAFGNKGWIGGLYYTKNIIYTLIKRQLVNAEDKLYILTNNEVYDELKPLEKYSNVEIIIYEESPLNKRIKELTKKVFTLTLDLKLIRYVMKYRIDYIYPITVYPYMLLKRKCVYWIPDFQHIHLPEMFSESEINSRNKLYGYIARKHKHLILSSKDSYNDYTSIYPQYTKGVKVLSFESYIEDDVKDIDDAFINETLGKYKLPQRFIFLPNQFWKHKNHITAFRAINILVKGMEEDIVLVCTGNTSDYRNREHFKELVNYIDKNNLKNVIRILGFISRKEQIALMKQALLIIQPSLFEGWGTVVEDAKKLGKRIIMSDISVHKEQKNDDCILFKQEDFEELANILYSSVNEKIDNLEGRENESRVY